MPEEETLQRRAGHEREERSGLKHSIVERARDKRGELRSGNMYEGKSERGEARGERERRE